MEDIKNEFPLLKNIDISYLDSAATTQKPYEVIKEIVKYYNYENGNSGRGSHNLAILNSKLLEDSRKKVASFVGVSNENNIVFTKNTTEAINILAFGYAMENLNTDDEIILCISNHHANIVPWQEVAKRKGCLLRYVYLNKDGSLDLLELEYILSKKTKIVAISSVVNSTGIINDFEKVIELSHKYGAKVILDCAQSMLHFKHEFEKWDVDFAAFSGHKMFANQGVGVLYGKSELLDITKPLIYGGDMVEYTDERKASYKKAPYKFEGGTLNIEAIVSLKKSIDFIEKLGFTLINNIENKLLRYALFSLKMLDFIEVYYEDGERVPIVAFNVKGVHSHDVSFILDSMNVAIRTGQHCCAPLLQYMGINNCCRLSLGIYNDEKDIDNLIKGLLKVKEVFKI